jgi:hypothetical protein
VPLIGADSRAATDARVKSEHNVGETPLKTYLEAHRNYPPFFRATINIPGVKIPRAPPATSA